MRQSNRRTPVVFHVGLVLFCLVLFSTYLTGGLYARYTTSASGSDSARVASFHIESDGNWTGSSESVDLELNFFDPAKLTDSLSFEISSASEVAVQYDVVITMPTLPNECDYSWLEIKLGEATPSSVNGNVYTFSGVGTFAPNYSGAPSEHTLTFAIKQEFLGTPPARLPDVEAHVEITIRAEQID